MDKPGKVTKEWLKVRREWIRLHPPNHEGAYLCGICLRPVHYTDMEIDHIDGRVGEHLSNMDNLQPTHRYCNQMKGSKKGISLVSKQEYAFRAMLDL